MKRFVKFAVKTGAVGIAAVGLVVATIFVIEVVKVVRKRANEAAEEAVLESTVPA